MNIINIRNDRLNFVLSFEESWLYEASLELFQPWKKKLSDQKKSNKRTLQLFVTRSR